MNVPSRIVFTGPPGPPGAPGAPGADGGLFIPTLTAAPGTIIAATQRTVWVLSYSASSPPVAARYSEAGSQPTHALRFQALDGRWFGIAENWIDVRTAGAMVDGSTDDAAAVSRARVAARALGVPTYFPPGTTRSESAWTGATDGVHDEEAFAGAGYEVSILKFIGVTGNCIEPDNPLAFTDFTRWSDFAIYGDDAGTTIGIWMASWRTSNFTRMEFQGFTENCVKLYGQRNSSGLIDSTHAGDSTYNDFYYCRFLSGRIPIYLTGTYATTRLGGGTANMNHFVNCRYGSTIALFGMYIEQGSANYVARNSSVTNPGEGMAIAWYGNTIQASVSENNGRTGDVIIANVDVAANTMTMTVNGTPYVGQAVRVISFNNAGVIPAGLSLNTTYYLIPQANPKIVKLATSLGNAIAGTAIDITSQGTGTKHQVQEYGDVYTVSALDTAANTLTLTGGPLSNPVSGRPVIVSSTGAVPGGLTAGALSPTDRKVLTTGTTYYVITTGVAGVIKLAATYNRAIDPTPLPVDLTDVGSGTITITERPLGWGVLLQDFLETKDNWVTGQHDGGSNDVGFCQDENGNSNIWSARTGLKLSQAGGSVLLPLAFYGDDDHAWFNSLHGGVNISRKYIACARQLTTNISISNNTATVITWNTEDFDDFGMIDLVSDATAITVPEAGKIEVGINLVWAISATGYRKIEILKNGVAQAIGTMNAVNGTFTYQSTTSKGVKCNAGDVLTVRVTQNSGGALDLVASIENGFYVKYTG